jgi:hypothetical protein
VQEDEGPYSPAWRRYRRLSRTFWVLFLSFLPGVAVVSRLPAVPRGGDAVFVAGLAWMIAFSAIGYAKWNLQCPRCGELFFHKFDDRAWRMSWRHNPFARRCMHCGLPKWAARDPGPPTH